ncbi:hypothetical protein GCM10022393_42400 [Aquimarina addita]|uniref:Uncharacterized protein n=1 Tax=Aquimarina addita TaxID=870485 RepID=A0ABP6UYA2_9FLAO
MEKDLAILDTYLRKMRPAYYETLQEGLSKDQIKRIEVMYMILPMLRTG